MRQRDRSPALCQGVATLVVMGGTSQQSEGLSVLVVGVAWPMETFIERLIRGLVDRGVEVTLRTRRRPSSRWLAQTGVRFEHGSGKLHREALRSQIEVNGYVDAVRAGVAGALYRGEGPGTRRGPTPDVVYAPWVNSLIAHPGLFELVAPVVTSCRGSLVTIAPWDPSRSDQRSQLAEVFGRCAAVHCVSERILDDAVELGLDPLKAKVIRPAVDPAAFVPASRVRQGGPVRVLGVGSLSWVKDYEHALVALRRSVDAGADLQLALIGDGPDRAHLRFAIDDLDLGDRVRFLGTRPPEAVAAELRRSQIFLHTSCSEGISNAVLEAMATGLPVVTTDAGGMREAVRDGIDGFVAPVRDAASISDALVRLAADPDLRARMGASGRQRVQDEFHLDQQIASFVELFEEAAGR